MGTVVLTGQLSGNIYAMLIGLLLCLICAAWSVRRNGSFLTGIAVCLFKITFSPCWVALMAAPWFLSDDQRNATKFRLVVFRAFMMLLMFKLVNGDRRWTASRLYGFRSGAEELFLRFHLNRFAYPLHRLRRRWLDSKRVADPQ